METYLTSILFIHEVDGFVDVEYVLIKAELVIQRRVGVLKWNKTQNV